jgi:hypothetical protein
MARITLEVDGAMPIHLEFSPANINPGCFTILFLTKSWTFTLLVREEGKFLIPSLKSSGFQYNGTSPTMFNRIKNNNLDSFRFKAIMQNLTIQKKYLEETKKLYGFISID